MTDLTAHWDDAYAQGVETRSWFEDSAADSLAAFDRLGVTAGDSVIDVGSGAAPLVGAISPASMCPRRRYGSRAHDSAMRRLASSGSPPICGPGNPSERMPCGTTGPCSIS